MDVPLDVPGQPVASAGQTGQIDNVKQREIRKTHKKKTEKKREGSTN
jgi:hypothetical protein